MAKSETIKKLNGYKAGFYSLKSASWLAPAVPFGIELGVNWDSWFGEASQNQTTIGLGFGMLLLSTLLAVVGVMKKDSETMKKVSPMFFLGGVFLAYGLSFILLASVLGDLGEMFLYSGLGILASAVADEVNAIAIKPKYELYKKLADDNGLSTYGKFAKKAEEQAILDAKAEYGDGTSI